MCPEIYSPNYKGSNKTDVYAMGVVLYMMIYNKHPYLSSDTNLTNYEKTVQIINNSLKKPSRIT